MRRSTPMRCRAPRPILFSALFMTFTTTTAAASHSTGTPSALPPAAGPAAAAAAPAARPPPAARVRGSRGVALRAPARLVAGAAAPATGGPAGGCCLSASLALALARQAATRALRAAGRQPRKTGTASPLAARGRRAARTLCQARAVGHLRGGAPVHHLLRRVCGLGGRLCRRRPGLCVLPRLALGALARRGKVCAACALLGRDGISHARRAAARRGLHRLDAPCARGQDGPVAPMECEQRAPRGRHGRVRDRPRAWRACLAAGV